MAAGSWALLTVAIHDAAQGVRNPGRPHPLLQGPVAPPISLGQVKVSRPS